MKQNKIIIGLIGGSGTGKSMLCTVARDMGYTIIDGDEIGHDVLQKEAYSDVVKAFGNQILDDNMQISRKKLGSLVFSDDKSLEILNKIMHRCIQKRMRSLITDKCIIDAAVLHKTELIKECTHVIAVTADNEIRIERIVRRDGIDKIAAQNRINSQPTNEEYSLVADYVIKNNCSAEEFIKCAKECLLGL